MTRLILKIIVILQVVICEYADCESVVKYLPGYPGPLPFHLETGYIGVGESEEVQLFYYFVKSERNASDDPLLLWLTGGPACSSLSSLMFEIGPMKFNVVEYDGNLPTLVLNPYSWTKVANIIFIDLPVGSGFSYARTPQASKASDFTQVHQANHFLRKWLMDHPEFLSNKLFIGGESYSGLIIPAVVQEVSNENEEGSQPPINLKGYLSGNPMTSPLDDNSKIPYAHGMALISDELYESLKRSCGGNYQSVDPRNTECLKHIDEYEKCVSGIENSHILEAKCAVDLPKPAEIIAKRRFLDDKSSDILSFDPELPTIDCRSYPRLLSAYWANDEKVRKALSIREGSIKTWIRCNYGINYEKEIVSSLPYHVNLSRKGFPSLIYSGDHDMTVPFLATQEWIRSLNYSIVDEWRPWHLQGQIAGYTRTYSNKMTFATVKGSGHTAPEYTPEQCFAMFERWIDGKQL